MMELFKSKDRRKIEIEKFRSSQRSKVLNLINVFAAGILCPVFAFFLFRSELPLVYFYALLIYTIYYAVSVYFLLVLKRSRSFLTNLFLISFIPVTYFCFASVYSSSFELLEVIYFLVFYCFSLFLIQRTYALLTFVIMVNVLLVIGLWTVPEVHFSYSKFFVLATFLTLGICAISIRYLREEQYQSIKGYSKYLASILNNPGIGYFLLKIEENIKVVNLNKEAFNQFRIVDNSKDEIEKMFRSNLKKPEIEKIWELKSGENFTKNIKLREFNTDIFIEVTINLIIINSEKYWFGQAKDVTNEVKKQQELLANEKRFRNLYYRNNAGVFTLTKDAVLVDANNAFYSLFEETIPIGSAMFYGETYQRWIDILDELSKNDTISSDQTSFTLANGEEKTFVFSWFVDDNTEFIEGTVVDLTEIQRASKLIEENENKYRTLFEESNDAILLFDKDVVIDANKKAIELFKSISDDENLIGSRLYKLGAKSEKKWKEKFSEIFIELETKKSVKFDWVFYGEEKNIEAELFVTKTAVNNRNYYQCIVHDNTLKNEHLKQIETNNANLQSILESNPQGIVILDENSIVYCNSGGKDLFGNPTVLDDLFSEKSIIKLKKVLAEKISEGEKRILRLSKTQDESELLLDTTIVATNYQSKEAVMLIFNDVTAQNALSKEQLRAEVAEESSKKLSLEIKERVRAEKKLQEEFLRSKAILDSSSNTYLLTLNTKFEITSVNSHIVLAAKDLMDARLFQGQEVFPVFEQILNDNQLDFSKRILNIVRKGKDFHGTICLTCKNNTNIWWEVYLSPIKNILGRVTEISMVAHDVSEKILADREIMESLREKEILLKEIHHRVKNNLQVISSILNLQSSFVEDDQTQDILMESRNRVRTMAIIHENLYRTEDFSSIDFGEYLSNLARNLVASYRVNKKVDLELDVNSVKLNIDQAIPCGLLVNEVVSNALKYAWKEDQEGKLVVKLTEGKGKEVSLEISDNGKGLPDEFEKINSDTLGLQLICTLVEQLDGELDVKGASGTNYFIKFERI